jgi:hypothetical protein
MTPIRNPLFAAACLALALTACTERESSAETQADMAAADRKNADKVDAAKQEAAEARAKAERDLAEAAEQAQKDMAAEQAKAMESVTDAEYKVMLANGKREFDVQVEACDAAPQFERDSCKELAEETYDLVKAEVQMGQARVRTEADRLKD